MSSNSSSTVIKSIQSVLQGWGEYNKFSSLYLLGSFSTGEENCVTKFYLSDVDLLAIDTDTDKIDCVPQIRRRLRRIWQHYRGSLPKKVGLRVRRIDELPKFAERMYTWGYAIDRHSILLYGEPMVFPKYEDTDAFNPVHIFWAVIERLFLDLRSNSSNSSPQEKTYSLARSILDLLHFMLMLRGVFLPTHNERVVCAKQFCKEIPVSHEIFTDSLKVKLGNGILDLDTANKSRRILLDVIIKELFNSKHITRGFAFQPGNWHFLLQRICSTKACSISSNFVRDFTPFICDVNDTQLSSLVLLYSYLVAMDSLLVGAATSSMKKTLCSFDHIVLGLHHDDLDFACGKASFNYANTRIEFLARLRLENCQLARRDWY